MGNTAGQTLTNGLLSHSPAQIKIRHDYNTGRTQETLPQGTVSLSMILGLMHTNTPHAHPRGPGSHSQCVSAPTHLG